jgi:CRISPR-associated protein Csb2
MEGATEKEREKEGRGRMTCLCISIRFLSPFYHGDPKDCDSWPPSPARLFQAMLYAAHMGANQLEVDKFLDALRWLESLDPPQIISCPFTSGKKYSQYGPTNDWDCKELLERWIKEEEFCPLGTHPSFISFPADSHLREKHMDEIESSLTILFSGETEDDTFPIVHYIWKINGVKEVASEICKLAEKIVALGWGTDMVIADAKILSEEEIAKIQGRRFTPGKGRKKLDVPYTGFLEQALHRFEGSCRRMVDFSYQKPSSLERRYQNYIDEGKIVGPRKEYVGFLLLHPKREEEARPFSPARWAEVVAWLRHALAEALKNKRPEDWINKKILGHDSGGHHVCFAPIPSIGHSSADGFIRRAMIVWDNFVDLDPEEIKDLEGLILISEIDKKEMALLKLKEDDYFQRFTNPAQTWASVSPVILHGYDQRRGKFSLSKCHRIILQAFQEAGYDPETIEKIWFQKDPLIAGSLHVTKYFVPKHLLAWPKYHVCVKFKTAVSGPVIIGIGQHYGFGLCASVSEDIWDTLIKTKN